MRLPLALCCFAAPGAAAAAPDPTCAQPDAGVCLAAAQTLGTIKNTSDPAACCAACVANTACVAWNTNTKRVLCYLRKSYVPNPGTACTSGKGRSGPSLAPTPAPAPAPPAPPTPLPAPPPEPPASDQRPRFHFMPTAGFTNDIQGPFYDPKHQLYHMGFAWHPNSTTFGGAPNRWYHIVSADLAHWQVVSTTPDKAMIKPGVSPSYDDSKPTTGSVTIVNGTPMALYSCNSKEVQADGGRTSVALAFPADYSGGSDPLLTNWDKYSGNPVMHRPEWAGGFRDPTTAWRSGGVWHALTTCGANCSGTGQASSAAVYSSTDFHSWKFKGTMWDFEESMMECPDFFPVTPTTTPPLHVLKYSWHQKEWALVGTYDEVNQKLINPVAEAQHLDAGPVYASKSFWDPVHQQRVWSGWLRERWLTTGEHRGCANISVCSTHTLPRAVVYDAEIQSVVTPPIPQLELLRGRRLASLSRLAVADGEVKALPGVTGLQLELAATFAVPPQQGVAATVGIAARWAGAGGSQRTDCSVTLYGGGQASLNTTVMNTGGVVDSGKKGKRLGMPLPLKAGDANVTLRCFVDHSVFEAYAMGGRAAMATRTYPLDSADGVAVFATGASATLLALDAWEVGSIWVDHV